MWVNCIAVRLYKIMIYLILSEFFKFQIFTKLNFFLNLILVFYFKLTAITKSLAKLKGLVFDPICILNS